MLPRLLPVTFGIKADFSADLLPLIFLGAWSMGALACNAFYIGSEVDDVYGTW